MGDVCYGKASSWPRRPLTLYYIQTYWLKLTTGTGLIYVRAEISVKFPSHSSFCLGHRSKWSPNSNDPHLHTWGMYFLTTAHTLSYYLQPSISIWSRICMHVWHILYLRSVEIIISPRFDPCPFWSKVISNINTFVFEHNKSSTWPGPYWNRTTEVILEQSMLFWSKSLPGKLYPYT